MRTIIASKTHALISLKNEELIALSNTLNEVLNNSSISIEDCQTRIGFPHEDLQRLFAEIASAVDAAGSDPFELFEATKEGFSLQLRAISAIGAPADLSYDATLQTITELE